MEKMLRAKEAAALLGIGESTFWRWCKQGKLPQGVALSARCRVWKASDLNAWLEQLVEA